jgi:DNA-binding XRE family transcriptional regulator
VRESVLRRHWISADSRPYLRSFLRCCIRLAIVWRRLPFVGRRQQHLFVNGAATIMIIVAIDDTLRRAPSCSPRYADSIFLGAGTERPSAQGAISGPIVLGYIAGMSARRTSLIENLAANVVDLRSQQGLSQAELARLSGVHRSNLNRLEKALFGPTLSTIQKLAETLGVDGWELLREPPARRHTGAQRKPQPARR